MAGSRSDSGDRFHSLDGWRAISILAVLAAHLLPLGPHDWSLNLAAGMLGMVFFFTLSGFLVTHFLIHHDSTADFITRRFFRILPLAWVFMLLALTIWQVPLEAWPAHFLFYANFSPQPLVPVTAHLWSLCVEMQFYLTIALLHLLFRNRGLLVLPLLCIAITAYRIHDGVHYSATTWYRADEILAGAILALIYNDVRHVRLRDAIARINPLFVLPLLLLSCHPGGGFLDYLRPYFGALLIGGTLFRPQSRLGKALDNKTLVYIASISYALYVLHPALDHTWLGSGDVMEKYAKRPLLFVLLFLLAHLSTRYFEQPCTAFGKRFAARLGRRNAAPRPVLEP